jgi:hypothetical protein
MAVYRVTVESPYGENGVRLFEIEAADTIDAYEAAGKDCRYGEGKIILVEKIQ